MKKSGRPHKKLLVWQKSMDLIEQIYRVTKTFPEEERYGLVSQMRRAAISMATNIAEGAARQTVKEATQFFFISRGSMSELDTQLEIAKRLGFLDAEQHDAMISDLEQVSALMNGLISHKQASSSPHHLVTSSLT